MTTAVVAQSKQRATQIAHELGIEWVGRPLVFGARCARSFEGLRVDRVIIDADAKIDSTFVRTIYANVLKTRGAGIVRFIRFVNARPPLDLTY